jgi:hypothetical protein
MKFENDLLEHSTLMSFGSYLTHMKVEITIPSCRLNAATVARDWHKISLNRLSLHFYVFCICAHAKHIIML